MNRVIKIPLRRRDGAIRAQALVDDVDAWATFSRWHLNSIGYVVRSEWHGPGHKQCRTVYLHREVLARMGHADAPEGDHISRDKLDCRRTNLRPATRALNNQNRTDTNPLGRGVSRLASGRYRAVARINGKPTHLGVFDSPAEAAAVAAETRLIYMPFAA